MGGPFIQLVYVLWQ